MSKEIYLTIIVPFRNEEKRLEGTIKEIERYTDSKPFETQVILADNHSTDRSIEIAKKYAGEIEHFEFTEPNPEFKVKDTGKGEAVMDGFAVADGKYIMFMDADSSTKVTELDKLLPFIEDYDIVTGSRYIKEPRPYQSSYFMALFRGVKSVFEVIIFGHSKDYTATGKQGRLRQLISRGGNLMFAVLLNQSYVDQRCGFKLYRKPVAKFLAGLQQIYDFGFDTEFWAIAQKYKLRSIEVPVDWYDDAEGTKVNPIKDTISSFKAIFRVQWNLITGKYSKKNARKLGNVAEEFVLHK
ncbi:hypothetical protein COY62_00260 [bacterium (Candidatus Howlettbacteria) CG_4_10_14_0_8_um_filter_40_9]|nr:MAG: hypothetical protein COY62_00260 [bacterium (Candidatus Howlettbacteria) CG_4_10_14_0_8_um_filter_40_9]